MSLFSWLKIGPFLFVNIFLLNLDFLFVNTSLISFIELKLYKLILYSGPGLYEFKRIWLLSLLGKFDLLFTKFLNCSIKLISSNNL